MGSITGEKFEDCDSGAGTTHPDPDSRALPVQPDKALDNGCRPLMERLSATRYPHEVGTRYPFLFLVGSGRRVAVLPTS